MREEAEINFYFQYDKEYKTLTLMICSSESISPQEYEACLVDFLKDHEGKKMEELFTRHEFESTLN